MKNHFVETDNVRWMVNTATSLENGNAGVPGLGLVHGQRGLGKTRSAIWYTARSGGIYLRAKSIWSPSWMLEELAVELGLVPQKRKKDLFTEVEHSLKEHPRLIIVDEANLPQTACLECLRDLHDLTENPVLFIGHEGIIKRLKRMGPFYDRFLYITEFKSLTKEDLRRFCDSCLDIKITDEALELIASETGGNFRKFIVRLKGLEDKAKINRLPEIDKKFARRAA